MRHINYLHTSICKTSPQLSLQAGPGKKNSNSLFDTNGINLCSSVCWICVCVHLCIFYCVCKYTYINEFICVWHNACDKSFLRQIFLPLHLFSSKLETAPPPLSHPPCLFLSLSLTHMHARIDTHTHTPTHTLNHGHQCHGSSHCDKHLKADTPSMAILHLLCNTHTKANRRDILYMCSSKNSELVQH